MAWGNNISTLGDLSCADPDGRGAGGPYPLSPKKIQTYKAGSDPL